MDTEKQFRLRAQEPGYRSRVVLTAVKGFVLGALLSLGVFAGLPGASTSQSSSGSVDEAYQRVVERAVSDHRCSFQGFDENTPVPSALIRTSGGNVRVVSFEKGWDVYNGRRPGSLIAVCLEDLTR